jgi:DHA1 family putative efflux transporter-like MFS transporter
MNNSWKIYMLAIISFLIGTTQFSIVGMLDKIAASAGVSVSTAGQLITVFALGNAIGTPIVMITTAKMNQRKQLLMALIIILLGIASTLFLPGFILLMASRVVLGLGTGIFVVTAYSLASKLASPGRQGSGMSNVAMGFSSSLVFGVPIGRIIAASYEWKTIFWGIGLLCLVAVFLVAKFIPAMEGEASVPLSQRLSFMKKPRIAITLGVTFFVFVGFSVVDTYITPLLAAVIPTMESKMSVILLTLGIGSLIGSRLGGILADRIGIMRTLFCSMAVQALALVLQSTFSGWIVATILFLMVWEISVWTFGPTQYCSKPEQLVRTVGLCRRSGNRGNSDWKLFNNGDSLDQYHFGNDCCRNRSFIVKSQSFVCKILRPTPIVLFLSDYNFSDSHP